MKHYITGTRLNQFGEKLNYQQSFYRYTGDHSWSPRSPIRLKYVSCYIGTYSHDDALALRRDLKEEGFTVKLYGRGSRRHIPLGVFNGRQRDLEHSESTHFAIYIYGTVEEVNDDGT